MMKKSIGFMMFCILLCGLFWTKFAFADSRFGGDELLTEQLSVHSLNDSVSLETEENNKLLKQYLNDNENYLLSEEKVNGVRLEDNPNTKLTGELTEQISYYYYVFSVKDSSKLLLARLTSENSDYAAVLCKVDENGKLESTGILGSIGSLIHLNGLPVGNYAFLIYSISENRGQKYSFYINASNPSADIKSTPFWSSKGDVTKAIIEYTTGDVYSNGKLIYNTSTRTGSNLEWERVNEVTWTGGYEQRTHKVSSPKIKMISKPASYSSSYASSDSVVLIFCDVDTVFTYFHSKYQSGPDHFYDKSFIDTFGKLTPRSLDKQDFEGGNEHILVFDLNSGKVIDFYSQLNVYYGARYESDPEIEFCE